MFRRGFQWEGKQITESEHVIPSNPLLLSLGGPDHKLHLALNISRPAPSSAACGSLVNPRRQAFSIRDVPGRPDGGANIKSEQHTPGRVGPPIRLESLTMRFTQLSALLALAASANAAWKSVGDYIAFEKPVAKSSLLANIGDKGARAPGAFVRLLAH